MIEHDGQVWTKTRNTNTWHTDVNTRCKVITWPFGNAIHQVKILITYEHSIHGSVGIGLEPCTTREAAMTKGVRWAEQYLLQGPPSPATVFTDCFTHWKTIFRTRADVLNYLFFTSGCGYAWLDGALICKGPEDHLSNVTMFALTPDPVEGLELTSELITDLYEIAQGADIDPSAFIAKKFPIGPIADDGGPRTFATFDLTAQTNIQNVPDDVCDEWLLIACEAAAVLSVRAVDASQRELGKGLLNSLTARFGARLEKL